MEPKKLILSRKGFDSASGGCPSPIFPDDIRRKGCPSPIFPDDIRRKN